MNLPYTLTIQQPERGGIITADPEPDVDNSYLPNTVVTLTATPDEGFIFEKWEGHAEGTESTTTITMNNDKIVTA